MKKVLYLIILVILFSFLVSEAMNAEDYLDFKEIIKNYYTTYIYKGKNNQEFIIRELIKDIKRGKFIENFKNVEAIKIVKTEEIKLKESLWKFEKLNFNPIQAGNRTISSAILYPEPKIPRDYYIQKTDFKLKNHKEIINIKLKQVKYEIGEKYEQLYPDYYSNFIFNIELFLISEEKVKDIEKLKERNFIFKIAFIQDLSPLNSFEREIKVIGFLEDMNREKK